MKKSRSQTTAVVLLYVAILPAFIIIDVFFFFLAYSYDTSNSLRRNPRPPRDVLPTDQLRMVNTGIRRLVRGCVTGRLNALSYCTVVLIVSVARGEFSRGAFSKIEGKLTLACVVRGVRARTSVEEIAPHA